MDWEPLTTLVSFGHDFCVFALPMGSKDANTIHITSSSLTAPSTLKILLYINAPHTNHNLLTNQNTGNQDSSW